MNGNIIGFFIIKQIKKPRLCSPLKKWRKTLDCVSCFPLHCFRALPLLACLTTEQSTVEGSLFVKYKPTINPSNSQMNQQYTHLLIIKLSLVSSTPISDCDPMVGQTTVYEKHCSMKNRLQVCAKSNK